jgi:hypothetical protein
MWRGACRIGLAGTGIVSMPPHRSVFIAAAAALALLAPGAALAQMPPCANDFLPLRQQVEKDSVVVKAAIERKDRAEICNALKRFTASEAKFVKYMEENQSWCGIPPEAVQQMKTNHTRTVKMRGQACAAGPAAARPALPAGPGLSEALGTSRAPTGAAKSGTGTYDTLTGPSIGQ